MFDGRFGKRYDRNEIERQRSERLAKQWAQENKLLIEEICKKTDISTRIHILKLTSSFKKMQFGSFQLRMMADSLTKLSPYVGVDEILVSRIVSNPARFKQPSEIADMMRFLSSNEITYLLDIVVVSKGIPKALFNHIITLYFQKGPDGVNSLLNRDIKH